MTTMTTLTETRLPAAYSLTILDGDEPPQLSVRIVDESVVPRDGEGELDWGNADWPSDRQVTAEATRQLGYPVKVKFLDAGDDLSEAIYTTHRR